MSDAEIQKIFTNNLNKLLHESGRTQLDLSKYLGVSNTSVNNWCKGYNTPRMDKVDMICQYFGIGRSDLLEDHTNDEDYYTNAETAKVAQEIFDNKELRLLFDTARDAKAEDLQTVHNVLLALKKKERGED